jgi:hypothetical protein
MPAGGRSSTPGNYKSWCEYHSALREKVGLPPIEAVGAHRNFTGRAREACERRWCPYQSLFEMFLAERIAQELPALAKDKDRT